jgi:methylated-DNA-[protein]-cysteine S-methyltransferase
MGNGPVAAPDSGMMAGMLVDHDVIETPVGPLEMFAAEGGMLGLAFPGSETGIRHWLQRRFGTFEERETADPFGFSGILGQYFAGDVGAIDRIRVDTGGTAFQKRVWAALREIPVGTSISYATLAREVGSPRAVRAAGLANGQNPVCIVVPCHRVIASDGTLCGYGGGLDRKRWLLQHEGATWVERPRRGLAGAQQARLAFGQR